MRDSILISGDLLNVFRKALIRMLPRNSELAFRVGRKLVDLYRGDNDFDFGTNGEAAVARRDVDVAVRSAWRRAHRDSCGAFPAFVS